MNYCSNCGIKFAGEHKTAEKPEPVWSKPEAGRRWIIEALRLANPGYEFLAKDWTPVHDCGSSPAHGALYVKKEYEKVQTREDDKEMFPEWGLRVEFRIVRKDGEVEIHYCDWAGRF